MKKIIVFILLVSTLTMGRDILIGDKVDLAVSGSTMADIQEAFKDFEIENIEKTDKGHKVSLRIYNSGDHLINIGNRKLIISVKSSLDEKEKDREEIFKYLSSGKPDPANRRFPLEFTGGLISAFILGVLSLAGYRRRKKNISLDPKKRFYSGLKNLGEDPFYEISYLLREYTDYMTGSNLLSGYYESNDNDLKELKKLLYELDHIKFSGKTSPSKEEFIVKAKKIASEIEKRKEEKEEDHA